MENKEIKQAENKVNITGVLVAKDCKIHHEGEENECMGIKLTLRTNDGSEHVVEYFANKYKKDENRNFTTEEAKNWKSFNTIKDEYISLGDADIENGEVADVIKIGYGSFDVSDFLDKKENRVVSANKIGAKFANRVDSDKVATTPQEATFSVQGVINKLDVEMKNDVPTGNGLVYLNVIGYKGKIIPIRLLVPSELVDGFSQAGFYEGQVAEFSGVLINSTTVERIVTKQSFGKDKVEDKITSVKRYEITGGSPMNGLSDFNLSDEEYQTCLAKRKLVIDGVRNGKKGGDNMIETPNASNPFGGQGTAPSNPFGGAKANPFGR